MPWTLEFAGSNIHMSDFNDGQYDVIYIDDLYDHDLHDESTLIKRTFTLRYRGIPIEVREVSLDETFSVPQ